MASGDDDSTVKPRPDAPSIERRAGPRLSVAVPVHIRYESVLDFVETQSMNISRAGMFIVTDELAPLGSRVDFKFDLADGFTLLAGMAEVVRVVTTGTSVGMGIRFVELDEANRTLIDRIVAVNDDEGRISTVTFDFARPAAPAMPTAPAPVLATQPATAPATSIPTPIATAPTPIAAPVAERAPAGTPVNPIAFEGSALRLTLGPTTLACFTANPLINVRSGGLFVTAPTDVALGTMLEVEILDLAGKTIVRGKGKVIAKQDLRLGLRLHEIPKEGLARLQAEVAKLGPSK